jgi:hypothetical protein
MPLTAQIATLIDSLDTAELVRDRIAEILVVELDKQQTLAAQQGKNPREWDLAIFAERSAPWAAFHDNPCTDENSRFQPPLVNVSFDSDSFDKSSSNAVERQKATGLFHIDCYGYGVATDDGVFGHATGDAMASREAQRALRLVRRILMSSHYTYLDLRGTVWGRWTQSRTMFQPQLEGRASAHVVGARLALEVTFNEVSPQVQGQPLELISTTVKRKETGQIYLVATKATNETET